MAYAIVKTAEAKELEGYSLLNISRTDGKKGKSGMVVQVPALTDAVVTVIYNDAIGQAWIRSQIDSLRSELASSANKAGLAVTTETIGVTALLAGMVAAEAATRVSKESIGEWFKAVLQPLLGAALLAKGIPDGVADKTIVSFSANFQKLASNEVTFPDAVSNQLAKAMELIPTDSDAAELAMTEKVAIRLNAAMERGAVDIGAML